MSFESIPVIDLFAGPGGLGEGLSSVIDQDGNRAFDIRLSIEKDPVAHRTLSLRALFRSYERGSAPDCYYDYVRGDISRTELLAGPSITDEAKAAFNHAKNATLGVTSTDEVDGWIKRALGESDQWVLIGGPPCQAYSIAGRSRMRGADPKAFEEDTRHLLYKEYLRIIRDFGPAVFVMENVKGILSSKHEGSLIFKKIIDDLAKPSGDLEYEIRSFVVGGEGTASEYKDFIIESEKYGIPQMRHRVILFGVRSDLANRRNTLLSRCADGEMSVAKALSGIPALRSRLTREPDSHATWRAALKEAPKLFKGWKGKERSALEARMRKAWAGSESRTAIGSRFVRSDRNSKIQGESPLHSWYHDERLGGFLLHEARGHMRADIYRYLFASCFAQEFKWSPNLNQFPPLLLPAHENIEQDHIPFADRFRVQLKGHPSTTVVSHIGKDGHYYIHFDPTQCRSLTVREAARLQTFPDNYFFEGNRTEQYTQVGNAVPPWLAKQIGDIVFEFLNDQH